MIEETELDPATVHALELIERVQKRLATPRDPELSARAEAYMEGARQAHAASQPSRESIEWALRDKLAKAEREIRELKKRPTQPGRRGDGVVFRDIPLAADKGKRRDQRR
jgi:hypothetical protein